MNRCNLRQKPRVSYYEPDEPNLDEYIFCDECGDIVYEYCSIHGALLVIPDSKVAGARSLPACVPRAALTVPQDFLHLARSDIPNAGIGVFATLTLPKGVQFGPYRGQRADDVQSRYCWQIYDSNNRPSHVIDAGDPDKSNWMRYVNCARHRTEQNLVAYQYRGQIYYRTIKIVPRFSELLVFYGSEYAASLRLDLKLYNAKPAHPHTGSPLPKKPKINNENKKPEPDRQEVQETLIKQPITTVVSEKGTTAKNKKTKNKTKKIIEADSTKVNIQNETRVTEEKACDKVVENAKLSCDSNSNNKGLIPSVSQNNEINIEKNNIYNTKYSCDLCNYTTNVEKYLISHKKAHSSSKLFSCDICPYVTTEKDSLTIHLRTHTGEKPFACNVCDKKFSRSSNLKAHVRIHTGEKPFACNVCDKKFSRSSNLKAHVRIHTGEKSFACNVCDKKFSSSSHLKEHVRIHTGEKPFACNVCNEKFTQSGSLKIHLRVHTKETPYACNVCDKKFNQSSHLKTHIRIHTGEYDCEICDKQFSSKSYLEGHLLTHAGLKPHACDQCLYKTSFKSKLAAHIRKKHNKEK